MVTLQAATAAEQHLAQHCCFHDSCAETHCLPSDIKCSYQEDIMTTLLAENKITTPKPHPVKTGLVQNHLIRKKSLAGNS